jgi:hypothetical protein
MKYILTGRVVTMDAATVLQAGAVYVDGETIAAVQDTSLHRLILQGQRY